VKKTTVLALCLALPALLSAHEVVVHRTEVALKADGGALRARVEVTAVAWMVEVSGKVEGDAWSPEALQKSEDYLRQNLLIAVDGRPLAGRILRARYVREPWAGEFSAVFVFDMAYPLPSTGTLFSAGSRVFLENWMENEGTDPALAAGPPEGAPYAADRDMRARFRWSALPGRSRTTTIRAPSFSIPLADLRRARWEAWLESAALGFSCFAALGGFAALLLSAALFPPSAFVPAGRWLTVAAAAAGAFVPLPMAERALWAAVALLGLSSGPGGRGVLWWRVALPLGAAAAVRLGFASGAAQAEATAFSLFSPGWFGAGFLAPLAAVLPLRKAVAALHRRNFKYLSPQEYQREALFHRKLISRFLALAGLYWVLSPVWTAPR
jgi:hypothetical protein